MVVDVKADAGNVEIVYIDWEDGASLSQKIVGSVGNVKGALLSFISASSLTVSPRTSEIRRPDSP